MSVAVDKVARAGATSDQAAADRASDKAMLHLLP